MTNIIKYSLVAAIVLLFSFAAVITLPNLANAWGSGDYGDGCCDQPSESSGEGGQPSESSGEGGHITPPTCDIKSNLSAVKAGDKYTISWNVVSATPVNVYINNHHVNKSGSATYTFNSANNTETFTLKAQNGGGNCEDQVVVKKEKEQITPPTCDIKSNLTAVKAGEQYTISWNVVSATPVNVYINGAHVNKTGSATYTFNGSNNTETFTLKAQNGGGNCEDKVVVSKKSEPKPAAKCDSFTINRNTLPHGGGNITLTWNTTNATSVSISGIGTVQADGTRTVNVTQTTTFTLTANGTGGNDSCQVKVTVESEKPAAKCDFFNASRTQVPHNGADVTLSWGTTNATSVSISGIGTVGADGSRTVFVNSNKTFTLTANGTGGNDSCTVTITVGDKPVAKCDFFTASRTNVPHNGADVTLDWGTTNANSVHISGIGNVSDDGSRTVFVNSDRTYTLTADGAGGDDTCTVTIKVGDKPHDDTPRCDYFRIDGDDDNLEEGDRITLEWETTNANHVTIDPDLGRVSNDGSDEVTVRDGRTTYTLTARDSDGDEDTCTVTIDADDDDDYEPRVTPKCEFEISETRVSAGDKVTLSWETDNVDRVRIRTNHGKTIFDTDDYSNREARRYFDGEIDVIVKESTEFTLIADGTKGDDRRCEEEVKVDDEDIAVYEKRDQGLVIALTQVPYTGFEAGPVLTFIFYAMLTLWALFIAYILVIKKGSILGFALYKQGAAAEADTENRKKVEALVAKYASINQR